MNTLRKILFIIRLPFFLIGGGVEFVRSYHLTTIGLLSAQLYILREAVERGQKLGLQDDYLVDMLTMLEGVKGNPTNTADALLKLLVNKLNQCGKLDEFCKDAKDLT